MPRWKRESPGGWRALRGLDEEGLTGRRRYMASRYSRPKRRATKKKKATARKKVEGRKPLSRKRATISRRAKSTTVRTSGKKKTEAKRHTPKRGKKRQVAKRPVAKRPKKPAKASKPKKKVRANPSKKTVVKRPLTRKRLPKKAAVTATAKVRGLAQAKARQAALDRLAKTKDKLRRKKKRKPAGGKKRLQKERKRIEKQALAQKLRSDKLPRKTPSETRQSAKQLFDRLRKRFRELLDHAARTKQLPDVEYGARPIDSRQNEGELVTVRINQYVRTDTVESILYKIRKASSRMSDAFSMWMTTLIVSAMGERLVGSGIHVLKAKDADASMFQTQGYEPTGVRTTRHSMLIATEEVLLDLASEQRTVIYCHAAKIANFSRKIEE